MQAPGPKSCCSAPRSRNTKGGTREADSQHHPLQKHKASILHAHPESPRMAPASSLPATWSPMAPGTKGHPPASAQPPTGTTTANRGSPGRRKPWRAALLTAAVFLQHSSAKGNQEQRGEGEQQAAVLPLHPQPGPAWPHAACPGRGDSTGIKAPLAPQTHPWGKPQALARAPVGDSRRASSRDAHAAHVQSWGPHPAERGQRSAALPKPRQGVPRAQGPSSEELPAHPSGEDGRVLEPARG